MSKTFTDVEVFLQACGQKHANHPVGHNDLSDLYKKLILEEYTEFIEACMENDDAEQLESLQLDRIYGYDARLEEEIS